MQNSNVVDILKKLEIKQIKDFILYLESPLQSKGRYRQETINLMKILVKYAPDFDTDKISKEKIYKQVFDNDDFSLGKLDRVLVELFKVLRQFLLMEQYLHEENEENLQIDFAKILDQLGLQNKATNQIKAVNNIIEGRASKNSEDFEKLYKTSALTYKINAQSTDWRDDLSISQCLRQLDFFYISLRYNLLNHYLLIIRIAKLKTEINLEREYQINAFFDPHILQVANLQILKKIFDLYANPSVTISSLDELVEILHSFEKEGDKTSLKSYFTYLRNYCTFVIQNGHVELRPILHNIYIDNIEKGYLYHDGKINSGAILNITMNALKIQETEWAENFITSHKNLIVGDNTDYNFYNTVLALVCFYKNEHKKVLEILPSHSLHIEFNNLIRRLEIQAYYELKENLLDYKLDAFKMFINRASKKSLSQDPSELNANFIYILLQLINSKPGDPNRGETIIKRINEKTLVADREWLLAKARELK